jgi:uncharacterized membrane protein required for colicin V production
VNLLPQDAAVATTQSTELLQQLQSLGWVDHTALGVLLVFFVIGLFKGLIWQVSRIGILVAAYIVAGRHGHDVAGLLAHGEAPLPTTSVPAAVPVDAAFSPGAAAPAAPPVLPAAPAETTIYLAYVLLFLAVLVVLSLLAMLLQKLAVKAGLGFFDRLLGGMLGVATGGCLVLFGMAIVHMFFRGSDLAAAAESSHSLRVSRRVVEALGPRVPDDLRALFALPALQPWRSQDATGPDQLPRPGSEPTDLGEPPAARPEPPTTRR